MNAPIGSGSVGVFERDVGGPGAWGQVATLTPSDGAVGGTYPYLVVMHEDVIVVTAPRTNNPTAIESGAVYVYERNLGGPNAWGEAARLAPAVPQSFSNFGWEADVHGDTLIVGSILFNTTGGIAHGAAFVFEKDGTGSWNQTQRLEGNTTQTTAERFGSSVAIHGDTAVVGAPQGFLNPGPKGKAYVFERNAGSGWGLTDELFPPNPINNLEFGQYLAMGPDRIVVADEEENIGGSIRAGAIYLFERDQGGPGDWGTGLRIPNPEPLCFERFGNSLAMEGNSIAVGCERDAITIAPLTTQQRGAAYIVEPADAVSYCTAGTSASGCQAVLAAQGTPSASASSGFILTSSGVEGAKDGLFFFGVNGRQANPWGNPTGGCTSFQCVVPPVSRGKLLSGTGSTGLCDGWFHDDIVARWATKPAQNPGAGATVQAQLWYRAPGSPCTGSGQAAGTTSLSNGLEFTVTP